MASQHILAHSPEARDFAAPLFGASTLVFANGRWPEIDAPEDVIVAGPDAEWCAALCAIAASLGCAKIRFAIADLTQIEGNPLAWLRERLQPYVVDAKKALDTDSPSKNQPVDTTDSGSSGEPVDQPNTATAAESTATVVTEPLERAQDDAILDFHASIPPEGAESTAQPLRKRTRPKLAIDNGNLARAPDPDDEPRPAKLSDDSLADHFADTYGQNWRYVPEWGDWLEWKGDGWHVDKLRTVTDVCKIVTREALQWADARTLTPDGRRKINSKSTVWHVRDLASADRRLSVAVEELDAAPFLLGVPGGAVDLHTGKLLEAEREQYVTRRCSVSPVEGPHPLFDMVLGRACAGHDGMREYLLRWLGYFLTGDVREEAFIFLHGPGGSGKSTLIKAITEIMGEYAVSISMDAFMEQKHPRHSQEIAKLAGMRLVYASETEEGRRWNEALIKDLTGRDTVTAHKMRMDDFSFKPTFKLLLYGNSVPHLKSVGEEIRRRIHLIEYAGSLAQEDRDTTLKDRLVREYPAILATLITGCVDWQDCNGLGKPESVNLSVDEYLEGEDSLAGFIAECLEVAPQGRETSGAVYRRYKSWASAAGEYVGSQKRLVTALRQRGFEPQKLGGARFITGLKLRATPSEDQTPHWHRD